MIGWNPILKAKLVEKRRLIVACCPIMAVAPDPPPANGITGDSSLQAHFFNEIGALQPMAAEVPVRSAPTGSSRNPIGLQLPRSCHTAVWRSIGRKAMPTFPA